MATSEALTVRFTVTASQVGARLDRCVTDQLPGRARTHIQRLIDQGQVQVDGATARASHRLRLGQTVTATEPAPVATHLQPEPLDLAVVFEDGAIIVLDKPAGLVVHPGAGHAHGTLAQAILAHAPDVTMNGSLRPGIVHRLDKDTSGLMVVAKTDAARQGLVAQFSTREVEKTYLALVVGHPPARVRIDLRLGRDQRNRLKMTVRDDGRASQTDVVALEQFTEQTLVQAHPLTGRTHQIRVHLAAIRHPIVGDPLYGGPTELRLPPTAQAGPRRLAVTRQFLHAQRLAFRHPADGRLLAFESPLPTDLATILKTIRAHSGTLQSGAAAADI